MPHFDSPTVAVLWYVLGGVAGLFLLWLGYRVGRAFANAAASRLISSKEQELFTAQRGFKNLYEQELNQAKTQAAALDAKVKALEARVEEYRKKAAGFGGLFGSGGKRADAMYALLLENEALEDALHKQNEKMTVERTDAVKESLRNIGYRRVLMSQLLNDNRIKEYVREILEDEGRLPAPHAEEQPKLPAAG